MITSPSDDTPVDVPGTPDSTRAEPQAVPPTEKQEETDRDTTTSTGDAPRSSQHDDGNGQDRDGQHAIAAEQRGGHEERAPAPRQPGQVRPQPPRRTGVFLDPRVLREHVSDLLRTIVGTYRVDPFGNFSFDHESARVFVTVTGGPMGPMVGVFSVTNTGLELSPELARWMATTNHGLVLGTLSWDTDNDAVWLRHNLLGSHLDAVELHTAVQAVASAAAQVDNEIQSRFGGHRFRDRNDESDDEGLADVDDGPPATNTTGYL